ncbi:hypothetical protein P3G55_06395 [Leptospira sp. 96542]|nr:hypothetical protein [Leptospira sp. 96542]
MAKLILLSLLLYFLFRFIGRLLILPTKISENESQFPQRQREKDVSEKGKIVNDD